MRPLAFVPVIYGVGCLDCLLRADWLLAAMMWTAVVVTSALLWEK